MDDRILRESTFLADGAVRLAQQTGFFPVSIANSANSPRESVLSVDAVMDLASAILWPDHGCEEPTEADGSDTARVQEYSLLAMLLTRAPDAATLRRIAELRCDATALGLAHSVLAQAAENARAETIEREFSIFSLVSDGASFFLTAHIILPAF